MAASAVDGFDLHRLVIPAATREAVTIRWDGTGGFTVVTHGVDAGHGGWYSVAAGPGAME